MRDPAHLPNADRQLFVNYPEGIGAGYRRYLVKALRAELGLDHTPLRLTLRPRAGRGKQQDAG